jgi:hypothetical protein
MRTTLAVQGSTLHRKSGLLFVYVMVTSAIALFPVQQLSRKLIFEFLPIGPDRNTAGIRDKPRHPQCDDRRPGALAVAPRQSPASLRADRLIRPAGRATANVS